jgi:hypothetical protein
MTDEQFQEIRWYLNRIVTLLTALIGVVLGIAVVWGIHAGGAQP